LREGQRLVLVRAEARACMAARPAFDRQPAQHCRPPCTLLALLQRCCLLINAHQWPLNALPRISTQEWDPDTMTWDWTSNPTEFSERTLLSKKV